MPVYDALIIGAGPGGLAAAMLLGHAGLRVKVLERKDRPGGRCAAFSEQGFRFDIGPTFFLYPRVLEDIYRDCGHDLFAEVPMTRLDPQYRLIFGAGGQIDATPDVDRMEREIAAISPQDAGRFQKFMLDNRRKLASFRPILESPWTGLTDFFTPSLLRAATLVRPHLSLDADLGRHFTDPRIRLAFSFQSKYLGMSPFRCPSLFSILSFLEYEYGVWHPTGGCSAVSEHMARVAGELGVEFGYEEEVEALLFEGKRVVGVKTNADEYRCRQLVINADFARAMTRLVPDGLRRRWTNRKLATKRFSCSTYMLYLGIDGRYDDLAHHTIRIATDYTKNLDEIENQHVLSAEPSVYVQNACITDATLAPPGQSTLYVLAPVTHQHPNVDWTKSGGPFREVVLNQLEKLGLTDIRQRIRFERVCTPADWDAGQQIHLGATFNLAHNLTQMLHLRPQNRFEDLDGVYLVGGGTHPGSGLPVIYESARITSKLMLADARRSPRTNGAAHRSSPTPVANPTDALPSGS